MPDLYLWGTLPIDPPAKVGPEVVSFAGATNNFSVNYRNEPLYPRINGTSPDPNGGDLSYAYLSLSRALPGLCSLTGATCFTNGQCAAPSTCLLSQPIAPLSRDVAPGDPATPLLRAYAGDDVQVRTLVGGHINPHAFNIFGMKWLTEPSMPDSGWRASQIMGISEHFEELVRVPAWGKSTNSDYLWMGGAAAIEQAGGNWGLLRSYGRQREDLRTLPQNRTPGQMAPIAVCPADLKAPFQRRQYTVVALTAKQALGGALGYNTLGSGGSAVSISDPDAILYFKLQDLNCPGGTPSPACQARNPQNPQPLVLRANAGDCMDVRLFNSIHRELLGTGTPSANLPPVAVKQPLTGFPVPGCGSTGVPACMPSSISDSVGLHPQLVSYDVATGDGFNAGLNGVQTVAPGASALYTWYAGNIDTTVSPARYIPIEFGAANLLPSDVLNHYQHGLFGGLVIEPLGATGWQPTDGTTAVVQAAGTGGLGFREFVLFTQDGLQKPPSPASLVSGNPLMTAVNYKTNYPNNNQGICPGRPANDISCILSRTAQCCTQALSGSGTCPGALVPCGVSQTPTFLACAGEPVRFRLLQGGGLNTDQVFEIFGHVWAETPYMSEGARACTPATTQTNLYSSSIIGTEHRCTGPLLGATGGPLPSFGPTNDSLTDWQGSRMGHATTNHFDVVLPSAGGANAVVGDYLYRTFPGMHFDLGMWGIFRVQSCPVLTPSPVDAGAPAGGGTPAGGGGR
jgi:hypothetical protein